MQVVFYDIETKAAPLGNAASCQSGGTAERKMCRNNKPAI